MDPSHNNYTQTKAFYQKRFGDYPKTKYASSLFHFYRHHVLRPFNIQVYNTAWVWGDVFLIFITLVPLVLLVIQNHGGGGGDDDNDDRVLRYVYNRQLDDDGARFAEPSGKISALCANVSFLFACRNSILTFLFNVPFERALFWHKYFAWLALGTGIWHMFLFSPEFGGSTRFSGLMLLLSFAALIATSFVYVRRFLFEVFMYFHYAFIVATIVFGSMHEGSIWSFGLILWLCDLLVRYMLVFGRQHRTAKVEALPADVIRITFDKQDFDYRAGQYLFLLVPSLSVFEWHPFSISSSPFEDKVQIHIRVLGDYTKNLYALANKATQEQEHEHEKSKTLSIYFEGAYGEVRHDLGQYESFLLVSGGIGITPMQSICNQLMYEYSNGRVVKCIRFVWSCADKAMLEGLINVEADEPRSNFKKASLPKSFQPNLLKHHSGHYEFELKDMGLSGSGADDVVATVPTNSLSEDSDILQTEFYLTRVRDASEFAEANINPETQKSLKFGRPKLDCIFEDVAKEHAGKRVAVLFCGPILMGEDVQKACYNYSKDGVAFDFHTEEFEF